MTMLSDSPAGSAAASAAASTPLIQREHSLNDVRAIIDESCYQRSTPRAVLAVAQAIVVWAAPVVALAFTNRWYLVLPLWVLAGMGVAGMFVIGHDASHHALTDSRKLNRVLAQICMAPSAHVEAAWDLGHNRIHHGYTTREGFDFVWHPLTPEQYRELGTFAKLQHRLEWSWIGSGAYFLRSVWWDKMWRYNAPGKRRNAIIRDKTTLTIAMVLALGGAATFGALTGGLVAAFWVPVKLFVVPFLLFVQIIGFTVYVHHVSPEIKWWTRKEWTQFHGQMDSTTILRIPRLVNVLWFHNIFVHVPHHVDARIRFDKLPKAAAQIAAAFPDTVRTGRLSIREYLRATKACKLYDFDAGRWLPYSAARELPVAEPAAAA
jgi:acyl-lipid omega-6 desaturase (Delta-12 desaturase)